MSFYSRLNGFNGRAFGDETLDAMTSAMAAVQEAEKGVASANARVGAAKTAVDAAKALVARLTQVSQPSWWKRIDGEQGEMPPMGRPQDVLSAADFAVYLKYLNGFAQDSAIEAPLNNRDFDSPNAVIAYDLTQAKDDVGTANDAKKEADAAVTAAEKNLSSAKAALVKAQDARLAYAKKQNAADAAAAKAVTQAAEDAAHPPAARQQQAAPKEGMSPLVLAGIAVPLLGILVLMMTHKKSAPAAVAGVRRKRR